MPFKYNFEPDLITEKKPPRIASTGEVFVISMAIGGYVAVFTVIIAFLIK